MKQTNDIQASAVQIDQARLRSVLTKLVFAFFYTLAVSRLILQLNGLPAGLIRHSLMAAAVLLLLALLTWQRYSLLALSSLLFLAFLAGFFWRDALFERLREWLPLLNQWFLWAAGWLSGSREGPASDQVLLSDLITAAVALLSYVFVARFNRPLFSAAALVTLTLLQSDPLRASRFIWIFIAGTVVVASLARKQRRSWRLLGNNKYTAQSKFMLQALPAAFIALLAAALLMTQVSPAAFYSRRLEGFIDDLTTRMVTPLTGQQSYTTYSIGDAGYYPLLDRLGGPVELSDEPLLHVTGYRQAMLLRGLVAQDYNGNRWFRDEDETLYRFGSQMNETEQLAAFNQDLPDAARFSLDRRDFQTTIQYRLQPVSRPFQTLFLEGRPTMLQMEQSDRYQFFFNMSGQMYSKYWLQAGQSVRITSSRLLTDSPDFSDHVERLREIIPEEEQDAEIAGQKTYLQIPDLPEYEPDGYLQQLTDEITHDSETPYEKAKALRAYLMENFSYSLDVLIPPREAEFVTWFLETGEGYCVYYATALTMMSRMQGIPARYVEGFYAPSSTLPGGYRVVTGEYAHAWTEIYLAGLGWVAIDATPSGDVFNPQATPAPMPEDIDDDFDTPEDPLEEISPTPTLPPLSDDQSSGGRTSGGISWWLLPFLMLLILTGGYLYLAWKQYKLRHQQQWLTRQFPSRDEAVRWYRGELGHLLRWMKLPQQRGESIRLWLKRIEQESDWFYGREEMISLIATGLEKTIYDQHEIDDDQLAAIAESYDLLEEIVRQNAQPALFALRRVLKPDRLFWKAVKDMIGY